MVCLQIFSAANLSYSSLISTVNATIHIPKLPRVFSIPQLPKTKPLIDEFNVPIHHINTNQLEKNSVILTTQSHHRSTNDIILIKLYAVLEAVFDRVEMHHNIAQQQNNWNTLLLNSINMTTLTATTLAGVASAAATICSDSSLLALKLSSALLFSAATGLLLIINKINPSQLTEEQRNATRLFKQLQR
ncbi:hypothetical protein RYX36_008539 [Vicia faba]